MSTSIHQPSDKLFKLSLKDKNVAQDFLKTHLPAELLQKIDLTSLSLEKQTFVDETFKAQEADVIYQVQLQGQAAYIYILCEHQTEVDANMAFRLWGYILRLMEEHVRKHPNAPLPLVYPLVVYAVKEPWNAPLEIFPLFGEQESLAREWFFKPYQLFDIQRTPDETLKQHHLCGIMEFALKHQKMQDFAKLLETLFPWMHAVEIQYATSGIFLGKVVLQYLVNGIEEKNVDLLIEKADHFLSNQLRGEVMTLAQEFERRGVEKGEATILTQLLQQRFGELSERNLDLISQADTTQRLEWAKKLFEAKTLEDVFNE